MFFLPAQKMEQHVCRCCSWPEFRVAFDCGEMRSGSSFFFCIIWHSSLAFWGQTHRPSKFLANLPPTSTVGRNKLAQQLLHSEEASIYASAAAAEDTIPIQTVKPEQIDQVILAEEDDQTTSLSAVELQELIAASPHLVHRETFHQVFSTALKHSKLDQIDRIESLFQKMKQLPNCSPTRVTYELVQQLWLRCHNHQLTRDDPQVWMAHLRDLWSLHDESSSTNDHLLPRKSTYLATLKGLMQCQHKSNILDITKKLFDDMLRYSAKYPALTPDIQTANHVMYVKLSDFEAQTKANCASHMKGWCGISLVVRNGVELFWTG